tara:strand:+ start:2785 stop:3111 length:327 start_codon:yes stop_codon:yes gene_type:complete
LDAVGSECACERVIEKSTTASRPPASSAERHSRELIDDRPLWFRQPAVFTSKWKWQNKAAFFLPSWMRFGGLPSLSACRSLLTMASTALIADPVYPGTAVTRMNAARE